MSIAPIARSDKSWLAEWWRTVDHGIIAGAMSLLAIGMLLSLAAGPEAAVDEGFSSMHYVQRHALFSVGAVLVFFSASMLSEAWARRFCFVIFLLSFLLLAVIFFAGHTAGGAQRWIRVGGFSVQPSEFVKPALVVIAAWLLAQRQQFPGVPWGVITFAFFAPTIGLFLLQPDVGQAVLLTAAFVVAFFVSGLPLVWAAMFLGGSLVTGVGLFLMFPHVQNRVLAYLGLGPAGSTFQLDRAHEAIANGGLPGGGPGEGYVKARLPDPHTDFVYSVAGEELGFLACLGLILIYTFICVKGVLGASRRADPYIRAAGTGLFFLFGFQAFINIGVNVGLLPTKGMTLPFISYGGSSMIGTALTLGLGLALTRKRAEFHPGIG